MSKKMSISSMSQSTTNNKKQSIANLKNINAKNDIKIKNNEEDNEEEESEKDEEEKEEEEIEEEKEEEKEDKKELKSNNNNNNKKNQVEEEKNNTNKKVNIVINLDRNDKNKNNKINNNNNNKNKIISIENENSTKRETNYKLKAEMLEKENIELKNSVNKKQEEINRLTKVNNKLRKNLEQVSSKVDILLKKANDNVLSPKKKKNVSENSNNNNNANSNSNSNSNSSEKEAKSKDMQLKNSLSMIHYLTKDNKKLRKEIENLNKISPADVHSTELLLKKKEEEINTLNMENHKLKEELNKYKYVEKTIENLKKKIVTLNDIITRQIAKINTLKEENKKYSNALDNNNNNNNSNNENPSNDNSHVNNTKLMKIIQKNKNKKNNSKILNSNSQNNSRNKVIIFRQRSSSLRNIKKKKDMKFCSTNKNFYKLFNESEQKAISTLFESEEDLTIFKQKIGILENRNCVAEKQYEKEIKDLKSMINDKDVTIQGLNIKIRENEMKIKVLENQSKEKEKGHTGPRKKQNGKKVDIDQLLKEYGAVPQNYKNKNEQIEKLKEIIRNLKEELNKYIVEKSTQKEINNIKNEIGVANMIDLEKILSNEKKFMESILEIRKNEVQIFIKGNNNGKETSNFTNFKNASRDNKRSYSNFSITTKNSKSLSRNKNNNNINNKSTKGKK